MSVLGPGSALAGLGENLCSPRKNWSTRLALCISIPLYNILWISALYKYSLFRGVDSSRGYSIFYPDAFNA